MSDLVQGSPEWLAIKCGKFSASRASDLMAKGRSGQPSRTRANLIATLACERMNGVYMDTFRNAAMDRGNHLEEEAANAYSFATGLALDKVAWVAHPTMANVGCSPDRLVEDDGLAEIKCPEAPGVHVDALLRGSHATDHFLQVQFQMMVTGRRWCDVVSYDPRWSPGIRLAIKRVPRDDAAIKDLVGAIAIAEREVEALIRELKDLQERAAA